MQATEAPAPAPAPAPADPVAERAGLMGDPAFAKAAANPTSAEWQRLTEVNTRIAAAQDAATAAADAEAAKMLRQDGAPAPDPVAADDSFDPPASPTEYALWPGDDEQWLGFINRSGLQPDLDFDQHLRAGLHAAGVDATTALLGYTAAVSAAMVKSPEAFEARQMQQHSVTEASLRLRWGASFDRKVELAQQEARAIFSKLPASVTRGQSFEDWVESRGIGNHEGLIVRLVARAEARQGR